MERPRLLSLGPVAHYCSQSCLPILEHRNFGWIKLRYEALLSTSAEFFDPKAMQLHTACSIDFLLSTSGT
jgi:F420-dependent methylenetetrahydromethanopterin dehydrogenase